MTASASGSVSASVWADSGPFAAMGMGDLTLLIACSQVPPAAAIAAAAAVTATAAAGIKP